MLSAALNAILVMLALSIGWGIRGNFGHQYGAAIAGALAGLAVCLVSGRPDWHRRVLYFGLFGALGWAFGGTMAYMPVIGYTHSGDWYNQLYGFVVIFVTGFLWSSLGGAGTAYAAVESEEDIAAFLKPLAWVLAVWTFDYFLEARYSRSGFRQASPTYWLDSNWITTAEAILAVSACDLWDRRFSRLPHLFGFAALGAALGALLQWTGWIDPIARFLIRPQGDLTQSFDPAAYITNWPILFSDIAPHLGWIFGLILGAGVYFYRYGRWSNSASLILYMGLGAYAFFLALPVLGGIRMVAPRGDNWAMVLGALAGALLFARRRRLYPVVEATLITGTLGGLGFMLVQFMKLLALMPGNPVLTHDPTTIAAWSHWHSANWHSILAEQGAGLLYGLGLALAMFTVARRTAPQPAPAQSMPRWPLVLAAVFLLSGIPYTNLVKNVEEWTKTRAVPPSMKMPLFPWIDLPSLDWFNLAWAAFTLALIALLALHLRRPLALVPTTWQGRGQLVFLVFLWIMTIGNFERALVNFGEGRLATEATIYLNAILASVLILALSPIATPRIALRGGRTFALGLVAVLALTFAFTTVIHSVYGDQPDGFGTGNRRFGPRADWRLKPLLRNLEHR